MSFERAMDPAFDPERRMSAFTREQLEKQGQLRIPFEGDVDSSPSNPATPEPSPTEGGEEVLPVVERVLDYMIGRGPIQSLVQYDLRVRSDMGVRKYGTTLKTHNGRSAMMDAYQEVLDAIMYSMQAGMEAESQSDYTWRLELVHELGDVARRMRKELYGRL